MENTTYFLNIINLCLIPKLSKNYDESTEYHELNIRNENLVPNFKILVDCLYDMNNAEIIRSPHIIARLVNLFLELSCDGPWSNDITKDISKQLSNHFEKVTSIPLDSVFMNNKIADRQEVFNKFTDDLHSKLTYENFKKFPAQIDVYCTFVQHLKGYNVTVMPSKLFPITLFLVEDYTNTNKTKGLKCCDCLLQIMDKNVFQSGNYFEVIYRALKRNLFEKDEKIIKLTHYNLLMLLDIIPNSRKSEKLDELYKIYLDQLSIETNLYSKSALFRFTTAIIQQHKSNCMKRSIFRDIICYNLDICTNNDVLDIILEPLLKCFENWIIYCWPVWKYEIDQKILSALFKVMYTCSVETHNKEICKIIVILFSLCTKDEQAEILNSLDQAQEIQCDVFKDKIRNIKLVLS